MDWLSLFLILPVFLYLGIYSFTSNQTRYISDIWLLLLPLVYLILINGQHHRRSRFLQQITLVCFLMFATLVISNFQSVSFLQSLPESLKFAAIISVSLLIASVANRALLKLFAFFIVFSSGLISLFATFIFLASRTGEYPTTFLGYTGGHNQLAGLFVYAIPLCVALFFSSSPRWRAGYLVTLVVLLFGLFTTLSRGAWLLLSLFPPFFLGLTGRLNVKRKNIISLLPFTLTLSLALFALIHEMFGSRAAVVRDLGNILGEPLNLFTRLAYYKQALLIWSNHLWFGQGMGTFSYYPSVVTSTFGKTAYPHGFLIQILVENGLVNFLVFLFLLFILFRRIFFVISRNHDDLALSIAIALGLSLIYSFFDLNLNQPPLLLLFFCLAFCLITAYEKESRELSIVSNIKCLSFPVVILNLLYLSWPLFVNLGLPPFRSQDYQKQIAHSPQPLADRLIWTWTKLDGGNGSTDYFLANYYFDKGEYSSSLNFYQNALTSAFNRPSDSLLLEKYNLIDFSRLSSADLAVVFNLLLDYYRYYNESFKLAGPWSQQKLFFSISNKLYLDSRLLADISMNKRISFWVVEGELSSDSRNWPYINSVLQKLLTVVDDERAIKYAKSIKLILDPSPSLEEVRKQIDILKYNSGKNTAHIESDLEGYLFQKISDYYYDYYQFDQSLEYLDSAIAASPRAGSLRLAKIRLLSQLGRNNESDLELQRCQIYVSPDCQLWAKSSF